jgi:hypothetical protein
VLAINRKADVRCEDLVDDKGINFPFSREEYDLLIEEFRDSIKNLYEGAIAQANLRFSSEYKALN